jgi:Transposase DDE domain
MLDSTLTAADHQYLQGFQELFPTRMLKCAVAGRPQSTRKRKLPLHLLLGVLVTWFIKPAMSLPGFLRLHLHSPDRAPSEPAIYLARGRLGWAPLRWLRAHIVKPLACRKRDADAFYQGWRLLAIDGSTFTVADTEANAKTFGRARNQHRASGYPLARVVAVCEVGTHAFIDWIVRSYYRSENHLAYRLLPRVPSGSLLLADRCFHSYELWHAGQTGGFELLIRVQKGPKLPVTKVLRDGSYLSAVYPRRGKNQKERAIVVRVIRYQWIDAKGKQQESRLVTSLLEAVAHPARELMELYHRRWEHEICQPFYLLRCACISARAGTTVWLLSRKDGDFLCVFSASCRGCQFAGDGAIALRFLVRTQFGQALQLARRRPQRPMPTRDR